MNLDISDAKVVRGAFIYCDHIAVVVEIRMHEQWGFKGNGKRKLSGKKYSVAFVPRRAIE